jgi:hypothetical protein
VKIVMDSSSIALRMMGWREKQRRWSVRKTRECEKDACSLYVSTGKSTLQAVLSVVILPSHISHEHAHEHVPAAGSTSRVQLKSRDIIIHTRHIQEKDPPTRHVARPHLAFRLLSLTRSTTPRRTNGTSRVTSGLLLGHEQYYEHLCC